MPRITDVLIQSLNSISAQYAERIGEPSHLLDKIREHDELGSLRIVPFTPGTNLPQKTMIAVDGARTSQKLAIGDLLVVGATVGEAADSIHQFGDEDSVPADAYATIIPHSSENDNIEQSLMAMMELRLLDGTKADVKIIDGSYLGNVATILFGLFGKSKFSTDLLLDFHNDDEDGCLRGAINTLIFPPRHRESDIVALTKSDSSFEFSKRVFGEDPGALRISDRILASRLLQGGEMFAPRALIAPRQIINKLASIKNIDTHVKDFPRARREVLRELFTGKEHQMRKLDNSENEELSVLWTTYFKPSHWSSNAPALRIEFPHYCTPTSSASDRARELISYIDQDMTTEEFLEPWCQYEADRRAKDVSVGTDIVKYHLTANVDDPHMALGLLRGYRS
jgi:hypothetical protein